jgi:phosphate transport system permease protein
MESRTPTFSGYQRQRKTRLSVRLGEIFSRLLITLGGIGTIVAIVLVCVFLVWVAVPLIFNAETTPKPAQQLNWQAKPLLQGMDSEQLVGWALLSDGKLISYRLDNGEAISKIDVLPGVAITAISPPSRSDQVMVGLADGSIRLGKIKVDGTVVNEATASAEAKSLTAGSSKVIDQALMNRQSNGNLISLKVNASFDAPITVSAGKAIQAVDLSMRPSGPILASLAADGIVRISEVTETKNLITGKTKRDLSGGEYTLADKAKLPQRVLINGVGDSVFLLWNDGKLNRISTRQMNAPKLVEEAQVTPAGVSITAVQFMIGKTTLLIGDSSGTVTAWFRVRPPEFVQGDGSKLEAAHRFNASGSPVVSLAVSARSRIMAVGHQDGTIASYNVTNELKLCELKVDGALQQVLIAPKEDGLYAWTDKGQASWVYQPGHHEATLKSLFRPVWYEGYLAPAHVWQSTSGDDAFEPKFGLWPLIFGTLKATFYSLIIAVPLALCAAIYSREFLHPKVRSVVKPTIEVMASLPSVVLGFLGALVIAPWVESGLTAIICCIVMVPLGLAFAGYLWHVLPQKWQRQLMGLRFIFMFLVMPLSIYLGIALAKPIETLLFGGDFKTWLNSYDAVPGVRKQGERGASGWFLLLLPLATIVCVWLMANYVNPTVRRISRQVSAAREAYLNLAKFIVCLGCIFGLAWLVGIVLQSLGLDTRTSFYGKYDQKNAFVAGLMMGFAIIPIIYTLAEDALSSVPDHLRSASLGCGATTWQTTSRIVIPTALAGIFSAVMVGLGRAVGETMIVLMVGGNVPVLDLNIFNGFRTLSANIAVELPEAVQNSTHYRILFLSALALFAFTFVLNTIAESLRQRFRKRAFEL